MFPISPFYNLASVRVPIQQLFIPFSNCSSFHLTIVYTIQQTFIPFSRSHYPIAVSCLKAISRTAVAYGLAVKNKSYVPILYFFSDHRAGFPLLPYSLLSNIICFSGKYVYLSVAKIHCADSNSSSGLGTQSNDIIHPYFHTPTKELYQTSIKDIKWYLISDEYQNEGINDKNSEEPVRQ